MKELKLHPPIKIIDDEDEEEELEHPGFDQEDIDEIKRGIEERITIGRFDRVPESERPVKLGNDEEEEEEEDEEEGKKDNESGADEPQDQETTTPYPPSKFAFCDESRGLKFEILDNRDTEDLADLCLRFLDCYTKRFEDNKRIPLGVG